MKTYGNVERETNHMIDFIGRRFSYKMHYDPDLREPMPLKMLELLGYVDAAEELKKDKRYPR